jgi:hypothetical protein
MTCPFYHLSAGNGLVVSARIYIIITVKISQQDPSIFEVLKVQAVQILSQLAREVPVGKIIASLEVIAKLQK